LVWEASFGIWNLVPLCLMWTIWRERNARVFDEQIRKFWAPLLVRYLIEEFEQVTEFVASLHVVH
jgi:hypothetical protein